MDKIEFRIVKTDEQPVGEAFETRILINGQDFLESLDPTSRGIYPLDFLGNQLLNSTNWLVIGICVCGCPGCSDIYAQLKQEESTIIWESPFNEYQPLRFNLQQYKEALFRTAMDHSWEEAQDTVNRLLKELDYSQCRNAGFHLNISWASSYYRRITIVFTGSNKEDYYLYIPWTKESPEKIVTTIQRILKEFRKHKSKLRTMGRYRMKPNSPKWKELMASLSEG